MCKCSNESGSKTLFCNNFCDCADWSIAEKWLPHLGENLMLLRDVLTYDSAESLDSRPAVLCVLGKCKKCGRQICFGGELESVKTFDTLMSYLFQNVLCCDKSDETKIEDMVIQLMHEEDRGRGMDWIYMNRDKAGGNRFDGIIPSFNEDVRHVPGYSLKLDKSLYIGLREKNPDFAEIAELSKSDINWLKRQYGLRVLREKEIAKQIAEYARKWNRYAFDTRVFSDAVDVAEAERPKHTGNQWIQSADGRVITYEISNAVYKMRIWAELPADSDISPRSSVWWELTVNALPKKHNSIGRKTLAEVRAKKFNNKENAEKYIEGRKKAYAEYFAEEFPQISGELVRYFTVNGVLLPEYTIKQPN